MAGAAVLESAFLKGSLVPSGQCRSSLSLLGRLMRKRCRSRAYQSPVSHGSSAARQHSVQSHPPPQLSATWGAFGVEGSLLTGPCQSSSLGIALCPQSPPHAFTLRGCVAPSKVEPGRRAQHRSGSTWATGGSPSPSPEPKSLKLGFLGLGIMGTAMARNLLRAGYEVTAWNRNPDKCLALLEEGAKQAHSPSQVTESSDITIAMLADPVAAVEVACGLGNAVSGLSPGKGYIDASTVDAETVHTIAAAVRAQGAQYLEAPVSGSKKPAEDGTLIFLAAGDKELYDRASDILDVLGKYKVFLGAEGNGANMKLVVNMVMGSMMAAFSEGLVLGEKAGLKPDDILDVISQGAISSPMFSLKGPSMLSGSFPPAFPLKHQQKDLRLAITLGDELAQALPVASAANEVYKSAKSQGYSDNDFSAVIQAVKNQGNANH